MPQQPKVRKMDLVQKAFSIRDSKAECFHPPFYKGTVGEAERDFITAARDEKSQLYLYPEDYDLFHVGSFDTTTGKFQPLDAPQHILGAINIKKRN